MGRSIVPNLAEHEVWFLTGSQTMYGEEVLAQVAVAVAAGRRDARSVRRHRLPGRVEAGAHVARLDPAADPRGERGAERRRDHHVDAHVQPRQDVDRRPVCARQADAPFPHAGQHRTAVGDHRLRLHEPQPGRPRRPRVRLHRDPARHPAHDRGRPRIRPHRDLADRRLVSRRRRLARGAEHERRPLRRQHALRRRDRGRQDRGRGDLRFADQHMGGDGPGDARRVRHRRADRRPDRPSTSTSTTWCRVSYPAPSDTIRCGTARRSRSGSVSSWRRGASARSPHRSRISGPCVNSPDSPCSD